MNCIKKILAVCSFCTLLTVSNCFAVTLDNTDITEDELNCYKTYLVQEDEQNNFIENLEKDIEVFGKKYSFDSYTSEDNNTTEIIDIYTSKKITSKTKNLESIIEQLGRTIDYEEDGYVGEYVLDTENIQIKTNYNGFKEVLIEETINYTNLEKNDLNFIPKQTTKDGLTLSLLNVEWEVESTKMIGEYEVANTYTAKCYYAEKQRINYPNTYSVTAEYFGTATKEIKNPYTYVVKYNKVEEQQPAPEKENNIILPIASGTTGVIVLLIIFFTGNITVYNYKEGRYVKIGKIRMSRKNTVNLSRYTLFEDTNKYKLEFSQRLTRKLKNKLITVTKGRNNIKMLVNTDNEKYIVEIRL